MTDHAHGSRRALPEPLAGADGPADGWDAHVGRDVDGTPLAAPGDLPVAEFTRHAHELVEWIGRYLAEPERYPVVARTAPGAIRDALPSSPPRTAEPLETILADVERVIVPGLTHWNHPGFHAYFSNTASIPGILGELLTSALNQNAMLWKTSPAATELEQVAMDWLRQLLGLGRGWFGMITDTASISTFLAIAAAREARPELDIRGRGLAGRADLPVLRVYCSSHAHSSVDKAVMALGLGHENCVHIDVDEQFRMRPDALAAAIAADVARGMLPIAVVATVGTTSVAAIDPVPEIAEIARAAGAWLHVDAAYGGAAAVVPELAGILDGVDEADSVVMNPHKWLFVPMDCSALWVKHPDVLKRAFALVPEYLVTREQDAVVNYMDYGVQLGRRFRALKLWMVMRAYGADGLAARVRQQIALTRAFADWVRAEPHWEVIAPVHLSLACIRHAPPGLDAAATDAHNERIMHAINAGGEAFLSHNRTNGQLVLRFAIGNIRTDERHVRRAWDLLRECAARDLA
ncbi:MAG: amino acid decarboxylase [Gemmatimonadetes bacterium]|nr:amino acid decarboxylase [Gemmatimonadota bacterium]